MEIKSNLVEAHIFREINGVIEFLLLKRSPVQYYPNLWQMVSGKIKANETAYDCALREIKEETGLTPLNLWVVPNINSFYTAENDSINYVPVFAAKVNAKDEVILSLEHTEFKWVSLEEAKYHLAWIGQHRSVEIINDYFMNRKNFWSLVEVRN